MSASRLWHQWSFPVPRGVEQLHAYEQLVRVASAMRNRGIRVDRSRALASITAATKRSETFTELFIEATGLPINSMGPAGSGQTKAVREWFRDKGAPDVVWDKRTKEPQFNAAALMCWAVDFKDSEYAKAAAALLGVRASKVNRKMVQAYYEVSGRYDGRIHFSFNVIGTKGTRWSSSGKFSWTEEGGVDEDGDALPPRLIKYSLNAQNIPSKSTNYDFGPGVGVLPLKCSARDCFIPDKGCEWIKWDYEGAEARLIAYNSGDSVLTGLIRNDLDIHTATARAMFVEARIPESVRKIDKHMEVLPQWVMAVPLAVFRGLGVAHSCEGLRALWLKMRDAAKTAMYALSYQAPSNHGDDKYPEMFKTWKGLFPQLSEAYFNECVKRFFSLYQGIKAWQLEIVRQNAAGEPWQLPQTGKLLYTSPRARGNNMRLNAYQQSGLGSIINVATPIVFDKFQQLRDPDLALLLQCHDELDAQVPTRMVDEVEAMVSEELGRRTDFGGTVASIPAAGDVGPNWKDVVGWKKLKEADAVTYGSIDYAKYHAWVDAQKQRRANDA